MSAVTCDFSGKLGAFSLQADFVTPKGVTALFGPSGAGKTSIIRAVCGLWKPAQGVIAIGEKTVLDAERNLFVPAEDRRVGAVFQEPLLFPHLSVRANILYGCPDPGRIDAIARQFDLGQLLDRRPRHLSGGEARRVALARAVARDPTLLVLDEPFAGLDAARRDALLPFLRVMLEEQNISALLVTHHVPEITELAQNVIAVREGKAENIQPVGAFVAQYEEAASR